MSSRVRGLIRTVSTIAVSAALLTSVSAQAAHAQGAKKGTAGAEMPRSATARCTDNSWSSSANQQGACSKHGGVAKWFGKKPKDATARCKDGEYWTAAERQGACAGHDGVAFWLGKSKKK
jgi:Ni/Co efflux regulator RcnB